MKKTLFPLILLLLCFSNTFASPSDSIDVKYYRIWVDTLNFSTQEMQAHTLVEFSATQNSVNSITLDLLGLTVDSVLYNGTSSSFNHDDTLLTVVLPVTMNIGDSAAVEVWYHGDPETDASGFGGFYFTSTYAYNIGVGFLANPHNFGRVWFPCKDNFTDRALYDYHITVDSSKMAVCGGTLTTVTPNGDGTQTWTWKMRDNIPTYLASMAVSDYIAVRDTLVSVTTDSIPVAIYVRPADSTKAVGSFAKLMQCLEAFEQLFGPYRWERVGYVGVPFTGGAMEHSTNIAYPLFAINGLSTYETLWAHELSHQYFGDLVTCETPEDMWLNEGFASYCEALFLEAVYDSTTFKDYVRDNLNDVLRRAHIQDGGYRAVSGIPHNYTYGSTVYNKGALVAHSIRGHMGTNAFFSGIKQYMNDRAFNHASSDTLKNILEASSGQSLDDFFDTWVYKPGFPHFSVDSFTVTPAGGGNFDAEVFMKQKLKGTTDYYQSNKVEVTFMDANWNMHTATMAFSDTFGQQTFTVPFEPVQVYVDLNERLADATTDYYRVFDNTSFFAMKNTYANITPIVNPDSSWIRVVHNWAAPDDFRTPRNGIRLNDTRYWDVQGILSPGLVAELELRYDGSVAGGNAFLDYLWLDEREDSLILFYREGPWQDWQEVTTGFTHDMGSATDKRGSFTLDTLKLGQYTLGLYDDAIIPIDQLQGHEGNVTFTVFPNPTQDLLTFEIEETKGGTLTLYSLRGQKLIEEKVRPNQTRKSLDLFRIESGVYFLQFEDAEGNKGTKKVVVRK